MRLIDASLLNIPIGYMEFINGRMMIPLDTLQKFIRNQQTIVAIDFDKLVNAYNESFAEDINYFSYDLFGRKVQKLMNDFCNCNTNMIGDNNEDEQDSI